MEKFNYTSPTTVAKCIGTAVSIIGAVVATLYQGPTILGTPPPLLTLTASSYAFLIGGLLFTLDSAIAAIFIISQVHLFYFIHHHSHSQIYVICCVFTLQAVVIRKYPAELLLMLFYSFFVAIFSAASSLIVEKDLSAWSLNSSTRLIPVIFSVSTCTAQHVWITCDLDHDQMLLFFAGPVWQCFPSIHFNLVCEKKRTRVCIHFPSFGSCDFNRSRNRHLGRGILSRKVLPQLQTTQEFICVCVSSSAM